MLILISEKNLLPFFKHEVTLKESTGRILQMHSGKPLSLSDIPLPPTTSPSPQAEKARKYTTDVRRIELVTKQRETKNELAKNKKPGDSFVTTTTPPLKKQPPLSSLANLKPLFLGDIDLQKDAVYKGYFYFLYFIEL